MPELPEVETIIHKLREGTDDQPPVPGHIIQSIEVTWDRIIAKPEPATFKSKLKGKKIVDAHRRGKFLHFPLDDGHLIGHLRMSGDVRMEKRVDSDGKPIPSEAYDRVIFNFISPWRMVFSNIRKFGRMWYVEEPQIVLGDLGPEPLSEDFTEEKLYEMLHSHKRQIKPLLMDQKFIAGLGNIYTDEILFRAKVHPLRKSDSLSRSEAEVLHTAIKTVLKSGIQHLGSSLDWIYRGGQFQNYFNVYKRGGEPCPDCGTTIEKISVGQRGTHFCPYCQEPPSSG